MSELSRPKKVIFVCVENSNRSQMAEAFARIHGGDKVEAFSAGSRPSGKVNPKAIEAMKEVGYDLTTHTSKGLDDFNGKEFDAAVTMGCGDECPLVMTKRRVDWQIPDPKSLPPEQFREVRDLIEKNVVDLLASLSQDNKMVRSQNKKEVVSMSNRMTDVVQSKYGAVAQSNLSSDNEGVRAVANAFGYSGEELASIPAEANMGLSCGNPTAMASLRPGEVVVDLGCGGGLDVFLAAQKVGPTGNAIGIDMTPAMIERAKKNADTGHYKNVEFHLATIDKLPLADSSVDVVISNCVINLAADKQAVFREIARVLKRGGRLAVSDIALKKPLPPEIADNVMAYVGCIAGAIQIDEYRKGLTEAGFTHVQVMDAGSDLNAYSKVEGQAGCCSPTMEKPVPLAIASCCGEKVEATESGCCTSKLAESNPVPAVACCDKSPAALASGCCTPAKPETSEVHTGLAELIKQYDVNEYAASMKVFAVKPL